MMLTVAVVMAAMMIAPGVAGARAFEDASQICKQFDDIGFGSHGACVSLFNTGNITAAGVSDVCKDPDSVALFEVIFGEEIENHGECVTLVKPLVED
jgi:hypothetical protein